MSRAAETDHAQERIYERRATRTRRSRWLGRVLFSLTGMGLLLLLRMNPGIVEDVVAWSHGTGQDDPAGVLARPADIHVRVMPSDVVPVRRGGTLPGGGARAPQNSTQSEADAVGDALRGLTPGG